MTLTGVFLNAGGVFAAGVLGALIRRGIPDRLRRALMLGLGLCVLYLGVSGFSAETDAIVLVSSIAVGVLLGEAIDIDGRLRRSGAFLQRVLPLRDGQLADAFVTSTLFVCVGAMSIVGGIESGTQGTYDTFLAKTVIDAIVVFLLATSKGVGCALAAVVALVYQTAITLCAGWIAGLVDAVVIDQMSEIGSLLIVGIALDLLDIVHLRIGNYVLAPFLPVVWSLGQGLLARLG